jgi:hypothetical protein
MESLEKIKQMSIALKNKEPKPSTLFSLDDRLKIGKKK